MDPWAQAAVAWAEQQGVIENAGGFEATAAGPRAQVVAWVVRALRLGTGTAPAPTFHDAGAIPAGYAPAIGVAQAEGLVLGGPNGNFHPADPITRAQMAVLLVRAERALAVNQGGPGTPFAWQAETGNATPVPVLAGSAGTGSASLPVGSVVGGVLTGSDGTFREAFTEAGDVGAGTVTASLGGQTLRVPFAWRRPIAGGPGTIWLYPPGQATAVWSYTEADGTVQVQGSSVGGYSIGGSMQVQTAAGGQETATACLGGCVPGVAPLSYTGPQLPVVPLEVSATAAFGTLQSAAGGG